MKKIALLFVFGIFACTLQAQEANANIKFVKDTIDYGTITQGSDGTRIFKFTNTGSIPLVINSVQSSCGCTVPKRPTEPILQGKEGEIQVHYDTNRVGPFYKTISVRSNAIESLKTLIIKGTVTQ
jgi:hypothetical protein